MFHADHCNISRMWVCEASLVWVSGRKEVKSCRLPWQQNIDGPNKNLEPSDTECDSILDPMFKVPYGTQGAIPFWSNVQGTLRHSEFELIPNPMFWVRYDICQHRQQPAGASQEYNCSEIPNPGCSVNDDHYVTRAAQLVSILWESGSERRRKPYTTVKISRLLKVCRFSLQFCTLHLLQLIRYELWLYVSTSTGLRKPYRLYAACFLLALLS
jgi:hypothetical protein